MEKGLLFRRDSGLIMALIVLLFIAFASFAFYLSYNLIIMGGRGDFKITAEYSGIKLYVASLTPGLGLAAITAIILVMGLPRVLHSKSK